MFPARVALQRAWPGRSFTSAPSTGHPRRASRAADAQATVGRVAGRGSNRLGVFPCSLLPDTRIDIRLVGAAVAALALSWLIPVVSLSTAAIVGFLLVSAAFRALLGTVIYVPVPLAVPSEALATPIVGVMNVAWAAMALTSPLAAGLVVGGSGVRWAFVGTAVTGFAVPAWMLVTRPGGAPAVTLEPLTQ